MEKGIGLYRYDRSRFKYKSPSWNIPSEMNFSVAMDTGASPSHATNAE